MTGPRYYEICIEGYLSDAWSDWFEGLQVRNCRDGATTLSGCFADQAALFGALSKVHALNLALISVRRGDPPDPDAHSLKPDDMGTHASKP